MHVAILGAGYAGLTVARKLERSLPEDVDITVVDENDYHLVQHELHRLLRRPELADVVRVPLDDVLDRASVRTARVESVDTSAGTATLAGGERLDYDYAAVCLGAETAFYDLPGVEEHATPVKRIDHVDRIRSQFDADEGGRVVVGGAGLSGVQVAGELAAAARDATFDADILLLERLDSVAPGFPQNFQTAVHDELDERGVAIRTRSTVARADADVVELASGEELPYDQFVWTGGIVGPAALGGERIPTRADLKDANGTFVLGDAANVVDAAGESVPASAQAAVREARVAGANIARFVAHDRDGEAEAFSPRLDRFTFDSPGWVVSVGDGAVAQVGPTVLTGAAAKAAKATVGASYLSTVGAVGKAADLIRGEL